MINQIIKLSFLLTFLVGNAQNSRKVIKGIIVSDKKGIHDVHVINLSSKKGTVSDISGVFSIAVKKGDSIKFSHLNYQELTLIISNHKFENKRLRIEISKKIHELDEIVLKKEENIFLEEPNLFPVPEINAYTLNLPYAKKEKKINNSVVKFRSGGVLSLSNLISTLNGEKRRKRELIKLSKQDRVLSKIRKYYTDDFFITDLQIKQNNINQFLDFCVKENIISIYLNKDMIKLTHILIEKSNTFPSKIRENKKLVLKN